jgi:hypothetical protein
MILLKKIFIIEKKNDKNWWAIELHHKNKVMVYDENENYANWILLKRNNKIICNKC